MGAVGPSHLLSTLNGGVGIFDKTTGAKLSQVTLQGFWASLGTGAGQPANDVFDPRALYDQHSGRFVVASIGGRAAPDSWILVAVSATSDPNGTWNKWAIDADLNNGVQENNWADFTGLGLDNGYLYIRANMIPTGNKVWVIPKPQLLAGANPITWTEFVNPPGAVATMQPAHVYGTSSAEYLVEHSYPIDRPPDQRYIRIFSITFPSDTPTWTDLGLIQVNYHTIGSLRAPQLGGSDLINTNGNGLLNAVFRNGTLWTTHTVLDNTESRTEVAWYQLDPATASNTTPGVPVQQGRIGHATRYYYYPSIAVNANGDVGIGFSGSSPTEYAGAYYTARAASDPPGTMQSVAALKAGLGYYSIGLDNRWGDYSATCVDPTDDLTFWTVQEYADFGNTWATWWGSFSVPPSSPPAAPANLSAAAVSSSQINLSLDGSIHQRNGIPGRAEDRGGRNVRADRDGGHQRHGLQRQRPGGRDDVLLPGEGGQRHREFGVLQRGKRDDTGFPSRSSRQPVRRSGLVLPDQPEPGRINPPTKRASRSSGRPGRAERTRRSGRRPSTPRPTATAAWRKGRRTSTG